MPIAGRCQHDTGRQSMRVTITFENANPGTIWNKLAERLGRQPTNAEAAAEVRRILDEDMCDRAERGQLTFQRRGAV